MLSIDDVPREDAEISSADVIVCAKRVIEKAKAHGVLLGCAESCTGGMVASSLTEISGSSAVFLGGIVSYALEVKRDVLGVDWELLQDSSIGAVSCECAMQMASGAAKVLGANLVVTTTGIAGPTGAEPGKPVGTVWFGIYRDGSQGSICKHFTGERRLVRLKATYYALELLMQFM